MLPVQSRPKKDFREIMTAHGLKRPINQSVSQALLRFCTIYKEVVKSFQPYLPLDVKNVYHRLQATTLLLPCRNPTTLGSSKTSRLLWSLLPQHPDLAFTLLLFTLSQPVLWLKALDNFFVHCTKSK